MAGYINRKILVVLIMVLPLVSYSGCKKQPKCGCGKDVLYSLTEEPMEYSSLIYNTGGTNAYFQSGMSTYYFCNPSEMYPVYSTLKAGDQLLISGDVFWECNYLYSASNYSYQMYYKIYQIHVTDLKAYLYGKK
jgi:hypothetical protein